MNFSFLNLLLCCLVNLLACFLLFQRWRQTKQNKSLELLLFGWTTFLLSSYLWCLHFEVEFGITFNMIASAIFAWLLIMFKTQYSPSSIVSKDYMFSPFGIGQWSSGCIVFISAGPLALIISLVSSLIMVTELPMERSNQLVTAAFVFPVIWGGLSFWVCSQQKTYQPFFILAASSVIASLILWLIY